MLNCSRGGEAPGTGPMGTDDRQRMMACVCRGKDKMPSPPNEGSSAPSGPQLHPGLHPPPEPFPVPRDASLRATPLQHPELPLSLPSQPLLPHTSPSPSHFLSTSTFAPVATPGAEGAGGQRLLVRGAGRPAELGVCFKGIRSGKI